MRTFLLERGFNHALALVVLGTLVLLITLTTLTNPAPLRSGFAPANQVQVAAHQ